MRENLIIIIGFLLILGLGLGLGLGMRCKDSFNNNFTNPIGFCIPDSKWFQTQHYRDNKNKNGFSPLIPGDIKTYIYETENDYYDQYSKSYYGITKVKGGWDCLRHYEIILSGAIPYFLDIDNIPVNTMTFLPKKLIKQAMTLKGVPSEKDVINNKLIIDMEKFKVKNYYKIRNKIFEHTRKFLLCGKMSTYMIKSCNIKNKKNILVHSKNDTNADYQRDLIVIGLISGGFNVYTIPDLEYIYSDYKKNIKDCYGKGMTYTKVVDRQRKYNENDIIKKIKEGYFDIYILTTKSNEKYPTENYSKYFTNKPIIFLDGSDLHGNHEIPANSKFNFLREK